jgi:hypothetical protein
MVHSVCVLLQMANKVCRADSISTTIRMEITMLVVYVTRTVNITCIEF